MKKIQKFESSKVEEPVVMKVKCRECQYEGGTEEELRKQKRQKKLNLEPKIQHTVPLWKMARFRREKANVKNVALSPRSGC